jgi:hypothetical protein
MQTGLGRKNWRSGFNSLLPKQIGLINNQSKICWNDSDELGMTFSKLSV